MIYIYSVHMALMLGDKDVVEIRHLYRPLLFSGASTVHNTSCDHSDLGKAYSHSLGYLPLFPLPVFSDLSFSWRHKKTK